MRRCRSFAAFMIIALLLPVLAVGSTVAAAGECDTSADEQYFPETQKCVSAVFYDYWQDHGGLAQQGLPISDEFYEISAVDGKAYSVQYFERARFEYHPENDGTPYAVLLGLLGVEQFSAKYPSGNPPVNGPGDCAPAARYFPETKRCVSPLFDAYWSGNGGLAQQGFPISNEFEEVNPSNGQTYRVQYFERARFEAHPENAAPYNVLLGLLGGEQARAKYPDVIPVVQDALIGEEITPVSPYTGEDAGSKTYYDQNGVHFLVKTPENGTGWNFSYTSNSPSSSVARLGLKNVRMDIDYTMLAGPSDSQVAVGCRMPDYENSSDGYYFNVGPGNGYYSIYMIKGGEFTLLADSGEEVNPLVKTGNSPSRLRIECVGDRLTLYINGAKVAEAHNATLQGNGLNFNAVTDVQGGGLDVAFRNLLVGIVK